MTIKKDDPTKRTDADVVTERTEADRVASGTGYGGPAAVPGGLTPPGGEVAARDAAKADDPVALRAQIADLEARATAAEAAEKQAARRRKGKKFVARHHLVLNTPGAEGTDGRREIAAGEEFDAADAEMGGLVEGRDYD